MEDITLKSKRLIHRPLKKEYLNDKTICSNPSKAWLWCHSGRTMQIWTLWCQFITQGRSRACLIAIFENRQLGFFLDGFFFFVCVCVFSKNKRKEILTLELKKAGKSFWCFVCSWEQVIFMPLNCANKSTVNHSIKVLLFIYFHIQNPDCSSLFFLSF